MRRPGLAAVAVIVLVTSAHIGDTNTHFRGRVGSYAVQVVVRHPGVVPGLADITIRVDGDGVRGVTVQPVPALLGLDGAPRPDPARRVPGEPGLYAAELWFMTSGAYSVHVAVDGLAGGGVAVVPVVSVATRQLALGPGLAMLLIALGLLLAAGLVTIVRAAVRDSVLEAGELPDPSRLRNGRIASAAAIIVIVVLLTGGRWWWGAERAAYQASMFEPLDIDVVSDERAGTVRIALVDPDWLARRFSPLVPDHGKLMHAFLVRLPDQDAFAHVHPEPVGSDSFRLALPPLPAGEYAFYADVIHETGFAQTLTDTVRIGGGRGVRGDPDDSWWTGRPAVVTADAVPAVARFDDGTTVGLERDGSESIESDRELLLRFVAREADGSPTRLEPYMGMAAHVAVRRDDGGVFVHLHPTGSFAPAAQRQVALAEAPLVAGPIASPPPDTPAAVDADSIAPASDSTGVPASDAADSLHDGHSGTATAAAVAEAAHSEPPVLDPAGVVAIPYAFPRAGSYRVFVQTRRNGTVRTAVFAVEVEDRR